MSEYQYIPIKLNYVDDEKLSTIIKTIRNALGTKEQFSSWYSIKYDPNDPDDSEDYIIDGKDILSWALALRDKNGRHLIFVPPRTGVTHGRLSSTFLQIATLVRGEEFVKGLRASTKSNYLIKSLTIDSKSFDRFYSDEEKNNFPDIIKLPFRVDENITKDIQFNVPSIFSGVKGKGEEAILQSQYYLEKEALREWGLIDKKDDLTQRALYLVDAVESWLLYEYSLAKGIEKIKDLLPKPLVAINSIETHDKPDKNKLSELLNMDNYEIDDILEPILHQIGIDRWMWKGDQFISLSSPVGDAIVQIPDRNSLWAYLQPGYVYPDPSRYDKWDPVAGVTPKVMEQWISPAPMPISIIIGKLGSGKTIVLGSLAMAWIMAGKKIGTLNTGMKIPIQPEDEELLVIVDDADRLPSNYLFDLLSTWQNPMGARLILTMRAEIHDMIIGEGKRRNQIPGSDTWKTIEIPEWTKEELKSLVAQYTNFFPLTPELIDRCWKLSHDENIPVVIASYMKDASIGIIPEYAIPPLTLQLKFLRLMADMLIDEKPEPGWSSKWAEAVFETYCCSHVGRCRIPKEALDELMLHFYGTLHGSSPFPYYLLHFEERYNIYRVPHWQALFCIPLSMAYDIDKETPIGITALEIYNAGGRISRLEAKRLGFLVEEFRKRREPESQKKYHNILRETAKKVLINAKPSSHLWLWPIESLHGMPDPKFSCLELYPKGTWTIEGVEKWIKDLDENNISTILERLIINGEQSIEASRMEASLPLFEVAGLLGLYAPSNAKHYAIQGLANTAQAYHKEGNIEKAFSFIDGAIDMSRNSDEESIARMMLPGLILDRAGILLEEGQWLDAEAWARNSLTLLDSDNINEENRSTVSYAWYVIAHSLYQQNKLNEGLIAIENAEKYIPSSNVYAGNLHGRIYNTKSLLLNLKGTTEDAIKARQKAKEEYEKAGDISSAIEIMKIAELEAIARCDMEEAQKISNEISRLIEESHGSKLIGDKPEIRELIKAYKKAKRENNVPELFKAIEAIIYNPKTPNEVIIDFVSEYIPLCKKLGRDSDALEALKRGIEATRKLKDLFAEVIFLQDYGAILLRKQKGMDALICYLDLLLIFQDIAPHRTAHVYDIIPRMLKNLKIEKVESHRGILKIKDNKISITPKTIKNS